MERNQLWILAGIFAAFAIMLGGAKDNSAGRALRAFATRFADIDDVSMVFGKDGRMGRIAGLAKPTEASRSVEKLADTEIKPVKKQDEKIAAKKAVAKLDVKNLKKKKAKKKKVTRKHAPGVPAPNVDDESETEDSDDSEIAEVEKAEPQQAYVAPQPVKEPKQKGIEAIPTTMADWAALILQEPNPKNVDKFIQYHRTNIVKDEVFYGIITKMLADPRAKMQELGVVALAASPSAKSFIILSSTVAEGKISTAAMNQAKQSLTSYSLPQYVNILGYVIQTGSAPEAARLEAIQLVEVAATNAIRALEQNTETPSEAGGIVPPRTAPYNAQTFVSFKRLLTQLIEVTQSEALRAAGESARALVNQVVAMNSETTPPAFADMSGGQ